MYLFLNTVYQQSLALAQWLSLAKLSINPNDKQRRVNCEFVLFTGIQLNLFCNLLAVCIMYAIYEKFGDCKVVFMVRPESNISPKMQYGNISLTLLLRALKPDFDP